MKASLILWLVLAATLMSPLVAIADVDPAPEPIANPMTLGGSILSVFNNIANKDSGISKSTDIISVITNIILWLLALSAVLAMGALVWGGIMYILSLGDEGRAGKAKQIILYAIIGVVVVLMSFVIISFVQSVLTGKFNPFGFHGIHSAYAAEETDVSKGFNSGIGAINEKVKPGESGLATGTDIIPIILNVVNYLLGLVAVLALAALIWGAVMYILSLGDEGKAEKAKMIILYAIIGVLLSGLSFLILNVIKTLFET